MLRSRWQTVVAAIARNPLSIGRLWGFGCLVVCGAIGLIVGSLLQGSAGGAARTICVLLGLAAGWALAVTGWLAARRVSQGR